MEWSRKHDPLLRFNERVIKDESGCWFWQGKLSVNGYAAFKIDGRVVPVHRWAYETYKGPIPKGLVLDHLCRQRSCVNPDHLEAVTVKENNIRRTKTHCFAGHLLTEENILMVPGGGRTCRLCRQEREASYGRRSKQSRQRGKMPNSDTKATKTCFVLVSSISDLDPLLQELEELKQRRLIVDFFRSESALVADSETGM